MFSQLYLRPNPTHIFECFVKVLPPKNGESKFVLWTRRTMKAALIISDMNWNCIQVSHSCALFVCVHVLL